MLTMLEAVAMPADERGRCEVRHFAYTSPADDPANQGGSVRDANNALKIVRQLVCKAEGRGATGWFEGLPPPGSLRLWAIAIRIYNSRQRISRYQVDYRRHNGCPMECTDVMMRTYRAIKRAFRNGREELMAEREARRKALADKFARLEGVAT